MFLLLVTLLFLPLLCLMASWYVQEAVPEFMKATTFKISAAILPLVMHVVLGALRIASNMRTKYVWHTRPMYPVFARKLADKCLCVDPGIASLCTSYGHGSLRVDEAILTHDGVDYDVLDMMDIIWVSGDGESVLFNLQRCMGCENVLLDTDSDLSLRVRYTGHRNTAKKNFPQTYSVRYTGSSSTVARFPPYPASTPVKKGLGVVKVSSAVRSDGVYCLEEARESAGLRGKFYEDVTGAGSPCSNVINFLDESDRIHEDLQIKVVTSKGGVIAFN